MRTLGALATATLLLLFLAAAPAYSQDRDQANPNQQQEEKNKDKATKPDQKAKRPTKQSRDKTGPPVVQTTGRTTSGESKSQSKTRTANLKPLGQRSSVPLRK